MRDWAAASSPYASRTAKSGIRASEYRVGSAALTIGTLLSRLYRLGKWMCWWLSVTDGPNESSVMITAVKVIAVTSGSRQRQTIRPTTTSRIGRPRYALYSAELVASPPADGEPTHDSGENTGYDATSA